jgi:2-amino-4-hydroxy-6-hydroxymethyldihydropteridine diphosphokinase
MSVQNQILLSLGSNEGNRKQNLLDCITSIHQQIGTVVRVSGIYESESWGFEGATFYNCAILIHSQYSAYKILKSSLLIEKKLGRTRNEDKTYSNRLIDIDLISYNQETLSTDSLQIPHPEMQNRNFVLQPLLEIFADWNHPVFQKSAFQLSEICTDTIACKKIGVLAEPLKNYNLPKYNYIAIEGNIGAGKTTLASKIAEDFNAKIVLERFADNPFLPKFYKDQSRYAFPLEMSFLADRYQQLSDDLAQFDLFKDFIIADYHIFKSLIFAKVTLAEDEYRLYKNLFDIIYKEMPKPDLYVYLYQNTERLLRNIKRRGRSYEQEIPANYLEKINLGYLDFIKSQTNLNVLIIDVSDLDFIKNQSDYIQILDTINAKIETI